MQTNFETKLRFSRPLRAPARACASSRPRARPSPAASFCCFCRITHLARLIIPTQELHHQKMGIFEKLFSAKEMRTLMYVGVRSAPRSPPAYSSPSPRPFSSDHGARARAQAATLEFSSTRLRFFFSDAPTCARVPRVAPLTPPSALRPRHHRAPPPAVVSRLTSISFPAPSPFPHCRFTGLAWTRRGRRRFSTS